jgi:hypothetical protein
MKIVFFQNELREVEEKFRQAMVANAGLDNEKSSLTYQVIFNRSLKTGFLKLSSFLLTKFRLKSYSGRDL